MTTTEPTTPEPVVPATPYAASPYPAPVAPAHRGSALAAAVALYLGGYIVLAALSGQLANTLAGYGPGTEYLFYFGGQLAFAVLAVIVGLMFAPAPASRKLIAAVVVVVAVVITLVAQTARMSGGVGMPVSFTVANPYFMTVLALGAAWMIVRAARVGWLALLLAFVLIPLPYAFSFLGVASAITQPALLIITGLIGLAILAAGRGRRVE